MPVAALGALVRVAFDAMESAAVRTFALEFAEAVERGELVHVAELVAGLHPIDSTRSQVHGHEALDVEEGAARRGAAASEVSEPAHRGHVGRAGTSACCVEAEPAAGLGLHVPPSLARPLLRTRSSAH